MIGASKKNIRFLAVAASVTAVLAFLTFGIPYLLKGKMEKILSNHGIADATITTLGRERGEIMFSGIAFDPDKFSTVETVRARVRWPALFSTQPFSSLVVDNMILTGEISEEGKIDIAGWRRPLHFPAALALPFLNMDSIVLNGGRVDLLTMAGALRIDAKGRLIRQKDGGHKIEGAIWGRQHQLVVDTRWDATIPPDGNWSAAADIREARLNLPSFSASRMSGWINLSRGQTTFDPVIAGQLTAGQAQIGESTALADISLTAQGALRNWHIIMTATAPSYGDLAFSADITLGPEGPEIKVSAETALLDDLLAFMSDVNDDMARLPALSDKTTSLLVTPGNIKRIRQELGKEDFDSYSLVIEGRGYDLTGKIVARAASGGTTQSRVVSMNPAER